MARKQRPEVVQAEIVALAKGGDGVARVSAAGKRSTLFVPGTAPGDVVEVVVEQGSRGRVRALLEPSPHRVQPPCPHADECGGCDWMHIHVDVQRSARRDIVRDALTRADLEVPPIGTHDAPRVDRYRRRARFAVQASQRGVMVGMRAARSHKIVPVTACLVLIPAVDETRDQLSAWLAGSVGKGDASVTLGHGALPVVHLAWQGELPASVFAGAEQRVESGQWAGVSMLLEGASTAAVVGDPRGVTTGVDALPLVVPPAGFMQAYEEMNHELVRHVVEVAHLDDSPTLELFAGAGNFTVALARHTGTLDTVEEDAPAVDAAQRNLELRGVRVRARVGDADAAKIRANTRVCVLDPPRTGALGASTNLAASKVRRIVMVSCDPATMARDAAILNRDGRFRLEQVDVFEMFPHTSHVETVAVFRRIR